MNFKDAAYYRQRAFEFAASFLVVATSTVSLMWLLLL